MLTLPKAHCRLLLVCAAILFSTLAPTAKAQTERHGGNPCDTDPSSHGMLVYDSNQSFCWLRDANPAADPGVRAAVALSPKNPDGSTPVINADGTMDWETALNWVNALNSYNNGRGWLNHNNWQLPANPAVDLSCSAFNADNFGTQCTGSALGNLYNVGLEEIYPESVAPHFLTLVVPFLNLQPGLYWAADFNSGGQQTFSFNTGKTGANTTKYNLFHVLPMTKTLLGPIPSGAGILPYLSGPGAGKAVYDTATGMSWPINANLPAFDNFGVTQTATITSDMNGNTNGGTVTVPLVENDGAVYLSADIPPQQCSDGSQTSGLTSQWILAMDASGFAGASDWQLPCLADLVTLYHHMNIAAGDTRLEWPFATGPFWQLQPGFYWACSKAFDGTCDYDQPAPAGLEWSFNFDDGFEGTDLPGKQFYVMVYFPVNQPSDPCGPNLSISDESLSDAQKHLVYDPNQEVCWLGNANLAADPGVAAKLGISKINPNGSMDYMTAVNWVAAMNAYNNGAGWLGHNNWQIPVAPLMDLSCGDVGTHGGSFGPGCTSSALGSLYSAGLRKSFPDGVAPRFNASIPPIDNLKLSYFWALQNNGGTSGTSNGGQEIFSFANGQQGGTTINDVYFYTWPMVAGPIGTPPYCPPGFAGVLPYTEGAAESRAVFDCNTGYTWTSNANLASAENFGISGSITILDTHDTFTVPLIDKGAMLFDTATQWVTAMNNSHYLGSSAWVIPASSADLGNLFADLNLAMGDARMEWNGSFGPFQNLQPFFYWACERNDPGSSQSPCTGFAPPDNTSVLQWTFNFDSGFQSTSSIKQRYFLEVYYPLAVPPSPSCTSSTPCRLHPSGLWVDDDPNG